MASIGANWKRYFLLLLFLILILMAIMAGYLPTYYVFLLTSIFMYIVITVSWATFCGSTGYISLASAAFFGAGCYVTAILGNGLPLPLIIVLGGLASLFLAFLVGLSSLRIRGIFFAIFTLGLSECLRNLVDWLEITISGRIGRWIIAVDYITCFRVMLIILVMTLLTAYVMRHSKFGLALRSIGENEEAAAHVGINVNAVKIIAFAISSFWMGATGAIMVTQWSYVDAAIAFDILNSFMPALMALFGGIGTIFGWVLGAILFTIIAELLLTEFPYYYMLIFGVVIIGVILFLPSGLSGVVAKWRKGGLAG